MSRLCRILLLAIVCLGFAAVPVVDQPSGASRSVVAPAYRNPLKLSLGSDGRAASCADPSVLRAHGGSSWYLYCTSDALTETEVDAAGNPVIHNVPMFRSTDLVHWTYVGDAFPQKPAWVAPDAGMWAPDVVYHHGQYRMYYAASDTSLPGGGSAVGAGHQRRTDRALDGRRPTSRAAAPTRRAVQVNGDGNSTRRSSTSTARPTCSSAVTSAACSCAN